LKCGTVAAQAQIGTLQSAARSHRTKRASIAVQKKAAQNGTDTRDKRRQGSGYIFFSLPIWKTRSP
jgi:hypothetical protein